MHYAMNSLALAPVMGRANSSARYGLTTLSSMVVLCALLVLPGGLAAAQSASSESARQGERASGSDNPSTEDRSAKDRSAKVLRRARERAASLTLVSGRIQNWLRESRGKRQAARSRCLDPLLSQAHAGERQGQTELAALEQLPDGEARERRILRLDYIVNRSRQILTEANACGKRVSKRTRVPTTYRVRLLATR
jgi:hypothetical protein